MTFHDTFSFQAWVGTDVGLVRKNNEDNYLVDVVHGLFVVADGMGGCVNGEKASRLAIQTFCTCLYDKKEALFSQRMSSEQIHELLQDAMESANQVVVSQRDNEDIQSMMGTTLSALLIIQEKAYFAHIGDSRIYLLRRKKVEQITQDHSMVAQQIRDGLITEEEAVFSPFRNVLLQAIGRDEMIFPQIDHFDLQVGDQFLLCSDGLHSYLDEKELFSVFTEENGNRIIPRLIENAKNRGGSDNITTIAVRVSSPENFVQTKEVDLSQNLFESPLLRGLKYNEVISFLELGQRIEFIQNEKICTKEQQEEHFFVLLEGTIRLSYNESFQKSLTKGDFFGFNSFVDGENRMFDAQAQIPSTLLAIQKKEFLHFLKQNTSIGLKILWNALKCTSFDFREAMLEWELQDTKAQSDF